MPDNWEIISDLGALRTQPVEDDSLSQMFRSSGSSSVGVKCHKGCIGLESPDPVPLTWLSLFGRTRESMRGPE